MTADSVCRSIHFRYIDNNMEGETQTFCWVLVQKSAALVMVPPSLELKTFHVRLGFVSLLACGGLCLLALAP